MSWIQQNAMKTKTRFIFKFCLLFATTLICVQVLAKTSKEIVEGIPIEIHKTTGTNSNDKSSSIQAIIEGHVLSVLFLEDLGQVSIDVARVPVGETQMQSTPTPHGVNFYIYNTGSYTVTFALANGDEYFGEFTVTD